MTLGLHPGAHWQPVVKPDPDSPLKSVLLTEGVPEPLRAVTLWRQG
jgi:hypothetical protein